MQVQIWGEWWILSYLWACHVQPPTAILQSSAVSIWVLTPEIHVLCIWDLWMYDPTISGLPPLTITGRVCLKSFPKTTVRHQISTKSLIHSFMSLTMLHWYFIPDDQINGIDQLCIYCHHNHRYSNGMQPYAELQRIHQPTFKRKKEGF